ncbi:MAG: 2-dehydropantoate 2-reductase [Gemmatimonadales bacterium]|nr:MAG: 2-dehydropantoate 2-reductase [Gemmatimonadales bacterium]
MRVAILGAGGVGGYFGGLLARGGHEVRLLARGPHLKAIRNRGLEVRTPEETFITHPFATDDPGELGVVDVVFVAVKAYSLQEVAPVAAELARSRSAASEDTEAGVAEPGAIAPGAIVIPFLNGVDAVQELQAAGVPGDRLLPGLTYISATRTAPGVVERRSEFQRIRLGTSSERAQAICQALRGVGVDAETSPDIQVELWRKFIFLTAFSAVCGLTRTDIGTVREATLGLDLLGQAVREIAAVGRACGISLPSDAEADALALLESLPPTLKPSFLRDVEAGGPNELDILSGAVARKGREVGVPTPLHDTATFVLGMAPPRG